MRPRRASPLQIIHFMGNRVWLRCSPAWLDSQFECLILQHITQKNICDMAFFPRNSIMHTESFEIFSPQKTLFLHHLCSLLRALNKKSSAYKPSPRHLLSGDTKGSASAYTIWAYFGYNQRVSSSVFQRSPIIIVVGSMVKTNAQTNVWKKFQNCPPKRWLVEGSRFN